MLRPLVLTGGPAVGKTTCGRALAAEREQAAYVDVDDLRQLVLSGAVAPWVEPGGAAQHELGVRNACAIASNFHGAGFEVVIGDVLTPRTAALYRQLLPRCLVVHLRASLPEARRRATLRPVHLTDAELEHLHRTDLADPPPADVSLHVDTLDVAGQQAAVRRAWEAAADHDVDAPRV